MLEGLNELIMPRHLRTPCDQRKVLCKFPAYRLTSDSQCVSTTVEAYRNFIDCFFATPLSSLVSNRLTFCDWPAVQTSSNKLEARLSFSISFRGLLLSELYSGMSFGKFAIMTNALAAYSQAIESNVALKRQFGRRISTAFTSKSFPFASSSVVRKQFSKDQQPQERFCLR